MAYDLHSKFDINKHKTHYVNYLEIIIFPDGHIEYAIPSHQEKLIAICCDLLGLTRDGLTKLCPKEYYFDFIQWLCNLSGCVSVWNHGYISKEHTGPNEEQLKALQELKEANIYEGEI